MIIAIPAEKKDKNSKVSSSFGRSPFYYIYDDKTEEGYFVSNQGEKAQGGAGVKAATGILEENINVLITPQLGENAYDVLKAAELKLYKSIEGTVILNINSLKESKLEELSDIHKGHHGH